MNREEAVMRDVERLKREGRMRKKMRVEEEGRI